MAHSISGKKQVTDLSWEEMRKQFGERHHIWVDIVLRETQNETNKYMLNMLRMTLFPNCCTKLMLNCFFLQSSYGYKSDICSTDNSTRGNHASCSFLPPTITNPDNYTIQVEAQNADGIMKSDITYWNLDAISKYHFYSYILIFFSQRGEDPKVIQNSRIW